MAERVVRLADSFAPDPDYRISVDAVVEHHRIVFNGVTIADSDEVLVLHETRLEPTYYFPKAHVRMDLMEATDHSTFCPFKGNASYWTVRVGENSAENALWGYEGPYPEVREIGGYVSFYRDRMDAWFDDGIDGDPVVGIRRKRIRQANDAFCHGHVPLLLHRPSRKTRLSTGCCAKLGMRRRPENWCGGSPPPSTRLGFPCCA